MILRDDIDFERMRRQVLVWCKFNTPVLIAHGCLCKQLGYHGCAEMMVLKYQEMVR